MKKLKETKAFEFITSQLATKGKKGKEKVKPMTIRVVLIGAAATILNALSAKYLGVSIPVEVITDLITPLFE